jgi:hypothetical protein
MGAELIDGSVASLIGVSFSSPPRRRGGPSPSLADATGAALLLGSTAASGRRTSLLTSSASLRHPSSYLTNTVAILGSVTTNSS